MNRRDYFAAHALQGLLASGESWSRDARSNEHRAAHVVALADALIEALDAPRAEAAESVPVCTCRRHRPLGGHEAGCPARSSDQDYYDELGDVIEQHPVGRVTPAEAIADQPVEAEPPKTSGGGDTPVAGASVPAPLSTPAGGPEGAGTFHRRAKDYDRLAAYLDHFETTDFEVTEYVALKALNLSALARTWRERAEKK